MVWQQKLEVYLGEDDKEKNLYLRIHFQQNNEKFFGETDNVNINKIFMI